MIAKPCLAGHADGPAHPIPPQNRWHPVEDRKGRPYRGSTCGRTLVATRETPSYRLKKSADPVTLVVRLVGHGGPVQAIVAAFGLDQRTIADRRDRAGRPAQRSHEHRALRGQVELGHVQADELYVFSAHRGYQEWAAAGDFVNLWVQGLEEDDEIKALEWEWLAMDGAMTKAPLGGERTGRNPTDRGKQGTKRCRPVEANGVPGGLAVEGANRHDRKLVEATLESSPSSARSPPRTSRRGCARTRGTTPTTRGSWCGSSASPHTSVPGVRRPGRRSVRRVSRPADGWWSGHMAG